MERFRDNFLKGNHFFSTITNYENLYFGVNVLMLIALYRCVIIASFEDISEQEFNNFTT